MPPSTKPAQTFSAASLQEFAEPPWAQAATYLRSNCWEALGSNAATDRGGFDFRHDGTAGAGLGRRRCLEQHDRSRAWNLARKMPVGLGLRGKTNGRSDDAAKEAAGKSRRTPFGLGRPLIACS